MSIKAALHADKTGNKLIEKALAQGPLVEGANEKAVRFMERMLKIAGLNPGDMDRKFTATTRAALEKFQAARGLKVTGELDPRTFAALKSVLARVRDSRKAPVYGRGQKNGQILAAEKRLRGLGYRTGKVDGLFDGATAEAMAAFKKDQGKKQFKSASGVLGTSAREALQKEVGRLSHAPYRGRVTSEVKAHKRLDAATKKAAERVREVKQRGPDGKPLLDENGAPLVTKQAGLVEGDKGRAVKNVQWHLRLAGFPPRGSEGVFDERTAGMVKAFQRKSGLEPTGEVDAKTWARLQRSALYAKDGTSPAQRVGERSAAVKRTEKLLKKLGFNPGKVDGVFDARTREAVKRAEKKAKIKADGVVGAHTLKQIKKLGQGVTLSQLRRIMPNLPADKAQKYLPLLNRAMAEAKINTVQRKAMFLAQLAHESVQLRFFEEIASGAAYEGRKDLGNTQPGDGVRFKGRGPIQLTGRFNYRAAGKALGLPLEANPKMAAQPSVGFRTAAWFWTSRGLNAFADRGDFNGVTLRINGGFNGLADRRAYYARALKALR